MSLPTHKIKQVQISIPPGWYSTIVALVEDHYVEGVGKQTDHAKKSKYKAADQLQWSASTSADAFMTLAISSYTTATAPPAIRGQAFKELMKTDMCRFFFSTGAQQTKLLYPPSVEIGIQSKTTWWEKLGIKDGQSATDRPARSIMYPSHGPGLENSEYSNVLIASRIDDEGKDAVEEKILLNMIANNLAIVHNDEFLDYHPWDWYSDPLALGAFAWFGPGQFKGKIGDGEFGEERPTILESHESVIPGMTRGLRTHPGPLLTYDDRPLRPRRAQIDARIDATVRRVGTR
ncbi:hypothetical protein BD779DRAFT_1474101 [Infundibulicybe gibba]|nr:hypothetical protein BD779DRAFT_1474101 [Infundibulicybe gibba]